MGNVRRTLRRRMVASALVAATAVASGSSDAAAVPGAVVVGGPLGSQTATPVRLDSQGLLDRSFGTAGAASTPCQLIGVDQTGRLVFSDGYSSVGPSRARRGSTASPPAKP